MTVSSLQGQLTGVKKRKKKKLSRKARKRLRNRKYTSVTFAKPKMKPSPFENVGRKASQKKMKLD